MLSSIQKAHLVSRRLIPADAKLSATPGEVTAPDRDKWRETMVRKLLVPAGARIGDVAVPCAPDGQQGSTRLQLFDDALLNKAALGRKRSAAEWLISFGIHAAIVAATVIVPVYFTQAIDLHQLELTYLVVPPLPPAPPPPVAIAAQSTMPKRVVAVAAKLTMPIAIPKMIPKIAENEGAEAPPDVVAGLPGGVVGGIPGGQIGGIPGGILGGTGPGVPPPPPVAAVPAPRGTLQLGGTVKPPRELYTPAPRYPILARQARIEGEVEIDAVIDEGGNVVQERAISGPGVLIAAALEAVKHWKYQPTYLNGVAWPMELTINVTFSLS